MNEKEAKNEFEKYLKNINSELEEQKAERQKSLGPFEKHTYIELNFHLPPRKATVLCTFVQYLDESNIEAVNHIINEIKISTNEKLK